MKLVLKALGKCRLCVSTRMKYVHISPMVRHHITPNPCREKIWKKMIKYVHMGPWSDTTSHQIHVQKNTDNDKICTQKSHAHHTKSLYRKMGTKMIKSDIWVLKTEGKWRLCRRNVMSLWVNGKRGHTLKIYITTKDNTPPTIKDGPHFSDTWKMLEIAKSVQMLLCHQWLCTHMCVRLGKYTSCRPLHVTPLHQQNENWHNNAWYFRLSKSQQGMKYLPITSIMHDTQCIILNDWTGQ